MTLEAKRARTKLRASSWRWRGFAGELHEGGFGALGDELDGVDEVFSASVQLGDSLLGREVFDLDVVRGGLALGFEGFELALSGLEGQKGSSFLFFVAGGGFGFVFLRAEGVGAEGGAGSSEFCGGAADMAIEGRQAGLMRPVVSGMGQIPFKSKRAGSRFFPLGQKYQFIPYE